MIAQNDRRLNRKINLYGCRFRSLQAVAEMFSGRRLSAEEVEAAYDEHVQNPEIMNENCRCGTQEHHIVNKAFTALGCLNTCRQVGSMQDGIPVGWDGNEVDFDFMILHWATQTPDGHFTLANKEGEEIFDPWNESFDAPLGKKYIQRKLLYKVF